MYDKTIHLKNQNQTKQSLLLTIANESKGKLFGMHKDRPQRYDDKRELP